MNPALLDILCCPESHQPLREAPPALLEKLNAAIRSGSVINRAGKKVEDPLDAALIRQDEAILYPIRHAIPILLIDQAIPLVSRERSSEGEQA